MKKSMQHDLPRIALRGPEEAATMKRITRNRRLTPEEVAKYKAIRKQVRRKHGKAKLVVSLFTRRETKARARNN